VEPASSETSDVTSKGTVVRLLEHSLFVLEVAIAILLIGLIALTFVGIVGQAVTATREHLPREATVALLDRVFTSFILLELLATAVAALRGRFVVRRVLEAALLAVGRKIVLLDLKEAGLPVATGIALLLAAIAAGWWLLSRAGAISRTKDR
jgi:uncharacterized membrane protein (DUF373 family)